MSLSTSRPELPTPCPASTSTRGAPASRWPALHVSPGVPRPLPWEANMQGAGAERLPSAGDPVPPPPSSQVTRTPPPWCSAVSSYLLAAPARRHCPTPPSCCSVAVPAIGDLSRPRGVVWAQPCRGRTVQVPLRWPQADSPVGATTVDLEGNVQRPLVFPGWASAPRSQGGPWASRPLAAREGGCVIATAPSSPGCSTSTWGMGCHGDGSLVRVPPP